MRTDFGIVVLALIVGCIFGLAISLWVWPSPPLPKIHTTWPSVNWDAVDAGKMEMVN